MSERLEAKATHLYQHPAERVFDAWIDPAMIGTWMFGPAIRDEEVVSIEIDAKVGGTFSFLVNRQNHVIDHIGTYVQIERPTRLEFDWGVKGMNDSSRVSVRIEPRSTGCELTLVHYLHPDWHEYLQRSIEGWSRMLTALETSLDGR